MRVPIRNYSFTALSTLEVSRILQRHECLSYRTRCSAEFVDLSEQECLIASLLHELAVQSLASFSKDGCRGVVVGCFSSVWSATMECHMPLASLFVCAAVSPGLYDSAEEELLQRHQRRADRGGVALGFCMHQTGLGPGGVAAVDVGE